ncbi:translation factor, SUA5 family [Leptospira ryugenii]|uniref:Threonylcarbamoyl-AMP synthase n=1 Tax=Leptospira ryugenii TaxID=1917863 RepID=A0A2P2DX66_9LEPT|nr:L-threonylcarbamoyladenylate synthase [Leptospira ryugenii]GBF49227.1 translation factor, SUA5 family [Leptospira ryugenii]
MKTLITEDPVPLGQLIREGGLVVFPTETVFGIGADSTQASACAKIYEIKKRPKDNPLIAHFRHWSAIEEYCEIPKIAKQLFQKFSPGPLALVLPTKEKPIFTCGLPSLAVRIPNHAGALSLLEAAKVPISAPSANLSGRPSLTRIEDVIREFDGKVEGILLGEIPEIGIESTVLDLTSEHPVLLRPGMLSVERIENYLKTEGIVSKINQIEGTSLQPLSPGMKYRHYAPDAQVILLPKDAFLEFQSKGETNDLFLGFHISSPKKGDVLLENNNDYMKKLYSTLVDADLLGKKRVICEMPKPDEYAKAILNRITKAIARS